MKDKLPDNYTPYKAPEPTSHDIDKKSLKEWKKSVLKDKEWHKADEIIQLAEDLTHISFEAFKESLSVCFKKFYELFPLSKRHDMLNNTDVRGERRSEKWVGEIVNLATL